MSAEEALYVPISTLAKKLSCNTNTIRRWVRQGILPESAYIKVGSFYRFNVEEAIALLKGGEVESKKVEIEALPIYEDEITGTPAEEVSDLVYDNTSVEEDEEDFVDFDVDEDL